MTEREMEDLLWEYPEKFLNEPLEQVSRQASSPVGRADLIFVDRLGRLLIIELKRDILERGAIDQLRDYYGMAKLRFPNKSIELMVVAARIPPERRLACEQQDIIAVEIPHKKFRDVAAEVGYTFKSDSPLESLTHSPDRLLTRDPRPVRVDTDAPRQHLPAKVEKPWYYEQRAAALFSGLCECSWKLQY